MTLDHDSHSHQHMLKLLTVAYLGLIASIVISADIGLLSLSWVHRIPFGDKACHFLLIGILSFLLCASLSSHLQAKRKRTVVLSTMAVVAILTSMEEMTHSLLASRQFSEGDMLCNIAGTWLLGSLALLIPPRKVSEAQQR